MGNSSVERLRHLRIFADLTEAELQFISSVFKEVKFKKDAVIFREGDPSGVLYLVTQGAIQISTTVLDDLEKPLVVLREGSVVGEVSLVDKNPREVAAVALEDTSALGLDASDFDRMLVDQPLLGAKMLKVIAGTVVTRIRLTTELYKRNIQWGLGVSGALKLNWHRLITDEVTLQIDMMDGSQLGGTLLKVEESRVGYELFLQTPQAKVMILPYHAVKAISFQRIDVMSTKAE